MTALRGLLVAATTLLLPLGASALCEAELAAEAPDVVLSAEIREQAVGLGFDAVRIYEFVRNKFEYEPYYGLMRGPEETLRAKRGNEYDLSALLVSLLRVSEDSSGDCLLGAGEDLDSDGLLDGGTRARFVRGRVKIPGQDAIAWTRAGSATAAAEFLAATEPLAWQGVAGLPVSVNETRLEKLHVWVEAEVPLARYRGTGVGGSGLAWVSLDPSLKLKDLAEGVALPIGTPALTFDVDDYLLEVRQDTPLEAFEQQVAEFLSDGVPGKSLGDVPIDGPIRRDAPGVLPSALPYELAASPVVQRSASLVPLHSTGPGGLSPHAAAGAVGANDYRWSVELDLVSCTATIPGGQTEIVLRCDLGSTTSTWTKPIAEIQGRRVHLFVGPFCGGSGGVAAGIYLGDSPEELASCNTRMAAEVLLRIGIPLPLPGWGSVLEASYPVFNGGLGGQYAVALDTGSWTAKGVRSIADSLIGLLHSTDDIENYGTERLLHLAGAHYMRATRDAVRRSNDLHHQLQQHMPWLGLVEAGPEVSFLLDIPFMVRPSKLLIDMRGIFLGLHDQSTGIYTEGFTQAKVLAALEVSAREHITWEELTYFEAISTAKGLQVRNEQSATNPGGHVLSVTPQNAGAVIDATGACNSLQFQSIPICGGGGSVVAATNLTKSQADSGTGYSNMTCDEFKLSKDTYCRIKNDVIYGNYELGTVPNPYVIQLCTTFGAGGCCQTPVPYSLPNTFYFRAFQWDKGLQCPAPELPLHALESLRIPGVGRFQYESWDGTVAFEYGTITDTNGSDLGQFLTASIEPFNGGGGGGGWPLWLLDPANYLLTDTLGATHPREASFSLDQYFPIDLFDDNLSNSSHWVDSSASVDAGDPVNVFTGNYHQTDVDVSIPGRGGHALQLARSYNSRLAYDGPLGYGWIHTFDQHLRFEPNETGTEDDAIVWVTESGGETKFEVLSETTFEAPAWSHEILSRSAPSAPYELVTKTGTRYRFHPLQNDRARLDAIIDRNGNAIVCAYSDAQNPTRLTAVTDTVGRQLQFTYSNSRLSSITDWTGRTWLYTVDATGDLTEFRNPVQVAAGAVGVKFEYFNGYPTARLDHNIRRIIQPEDRGGAAGGDVTMTFSYYANDAVQQHVNAVGETFSFFYDFFRRRTTVTYPDGSEEAYIFNGEGNVIRHESPRGVVHQYEFAPETHDRISETDGLGFETTAAYDGAGNIVERVDRVESPNPNPKKETWTYNGFSQPLSHVDRRGARREWSYDARGNLLEERTFVNGQMRVTRRHQYDGFGNRTKSTVLLEEDGSRPRTTKFFYAANGVDVVRSVDANVHEMRLGTDALSRVTSIETTRSGPGTAAKEALLATTSYDGLSRPVVAIDTAGTARRTIFDANGNVVAALTFVPSPAAPAAAVPATVAACQALLNCRVDVRNTFDAADRPVAQTNALGETTATAYDVRGRPIQVTSPLGHETRLEYDEDGNRVRTIDPTGAESIAIYDAENRVVESRDALGRITSTTYDREGRVLELEGPGNVTLAKVLEYDAEGNPLRAENANGVESQAVFDELGRRTLLREAVGEGAALEAETSFVYDLEGKLAQKTDALGRTTRVHYDVLGRLSEVRSPLGHASAFTHDEVGNRTQVTTPTGERIHFAYDSRGLVTRRWSEGGDPALAIDDTYGYDGLGRMTVARAASGATRFFEYDALDRAVAVTDPALGTVRQVFDADGRVVQIGYPGGQSVHYGYSARGEVTSVRDPAIAGLAASLGGWQLSYDALGRPVRERDPFGVERRTGYTTEGFVDRVDVFAGASAVESFVYSAYDDLGNPGQIVSGEGTSQIQYDARSRVEKVAHPGGSLTACLTSCERFEYDKVGNRTKHVSNGIEQRYVVDADDRLTAILDAASLPLASFTHDAAGRRAGRSDANGETSYAYDALGRLRSYQVGAFSGTLEYTATDERTLRTDFGGTTRYLGEWYEVAGTTQRRLIHGPGIDNVLGQVSGANQVRTLLRDGTANVVRTGLDGAVANPRRYEAFGGVRSGPLAVERGFAGRPVEGTVSGGLINVRARHYDPATGRFLQPDPLGISADQLYAYAANDPYRFSDPTGQSPWSMVFLRTAARDAANFAPDEEDFWHYSRNQIDLKVPPGVSPEHFMADLRGDLAGFRSFSRPSPNLATVESSGSNVYFDTLGVMGDLTDLFNDAKVGVRLFQKGDVLAGVTLGDHMLQGVRIWHATESMERGWVTVTTEAFEHPRGFTPNWPGALFASGPQSEIWNTMLRNMGNNYSQHWRMVDPESKWILHRSVNPFIGYVTE